jgi:uncharacterized protein YfiM (DUF2279 family)
MGEFPLRHARIWWLLGWCILALILVLSLVPSPPQLGDISDKWQHAFAYAVLMSWFGQLYAQHLRLGLYLVTLGIAVEFLQGWSGLRHFEVLDMLADAIGVLVGWLLLRLGMNYLSWFEL